MQILIEQEILGLQVAMDNLVTMAVLDGADYLLEELAGLCLSHGTMIDNVLEELGAGVLEDHDDLDWSSDDGVEFDNVWVAEELKVLNLSLDSAGHVTSHELSAGDDFEGNLLASNLVHCQLHLAKGALAESPQDLVLAKTLLCAHLAMCFRDGLRLDNGRGGRAAGEAGIAAS